MEIPGQRLWLRRKQSRSGRAARVLIPRSEQSGAVSSPSCPPRSSGVRTRGGRERGTESSEAAVRHGRSQLRAACGRVPLPSYLPQPHRETRASCRAGALQAPTQSQQVLQLLSQDPRTHRAAAPRDQRALRAFLRPQSQDEDTSLPGGTGTGTGRRNCGGHALPESCPQ